MYKRSNTRKVQGDLLWWHEAFVGLGWILGMALRENFKLQERVDVTCVLLSPREFNELKGGWANERNGTKLRL